MANTMYYTGTQINDSAVMVFKAAEDIADVRNKIVVVTADGAKVATGAAEPFMGIGLVSHDYPAKAGDDIHVQIKDIGLVELGAAVTVGAEVTADAEGKAVPATGGYVLGMAMSDGEAGDKIFVQIQKYKAGEAAAAEEENTEEPEPQV